jgi:hypothetical protein
LSLCDFRRVNNPSAEALCHFERQRANERRL